MSAEAMHRFDKSLIKHKYTVEKRVYSCTMGSNLGTVRDMVDFTSDKPKAD